MELPKFTAIPQIQYESWNDCKRQTGLAALIEQRSSVEDHHYTAKAAMVPVPATQKKDAKVFMAYHIQAVIERDQTKPRLMPGDPVMIDLHPDSENSSDENAWHGKVTHPTGATPMGMTNIVIERPCKDERIVDLKEYSTLTASHLERITTAELVKWTRANCNRKIIISTRKNEKECKRIMNNIAKMEIPGKLKEIYTEKERRLSAARNLFLCKDHTQSEATPLYHRLGEEFREQVIGYIRPLLRSHQLDQFNEWLCKGTKDNTLWINGPSGSGKTYLAILTMLPYMGRIAVPENIVNTMRHEKKAKEEAKAADAVKPDTNEPAGKGKGKKIEVDNPEPQKSNEMVVERGRITIAAMQNETVDSQYELCCPMAMEFAKATGLPCPLVLRLHSKESELSAVQAMTHPTYNPNGKSTRFSVDPNTNLTNSTLRSLLAAYIAAFTGGSPGIADLRLKRLEGAAATYIMEMANFPEFPASPELRAAFSPSERDIWAKELRIIVSAYRDLCSSEDTIDLETKAKIKEVTKLALDALIERASIICTTVSVATHPSFNMIRRAHAVALEEAGRANDAETMGFFSHYWNVDLRLFSGATNQLKPMAFSDSKLNPFHKTAQISTAGRIESTGGSISRLNASSRFKN
ncbi:hypothetical protein ACJQWK_03370 [Exserohilum turcicum]